MFLAKILPESSNQRRTISSSRFCTNCSHVSPQLTLLRSHRSPSRRRQTLLLAQRASDNKSSLKRKNPRPKLTRCDRCFWIAVSRSRSERKNCLLLVKPETVVQRQRRAFRAADLRQRSSQQYSACPGRIPPGSTAHSRRTADVWLRHLASTYLAPDGALS